MINSLSGFHLVLFFTRGVSLRTWDQIGMLDREVALYRRLQEHGVRVTFVTYGDASDLGYASRLPGIRILCNRWNLPQNWYERLLPYLHARHLWWANVIKANQTKGAEVALRAASLWRKPLIARCGYMLSDVPAHILGGAEVVERARRSERSIFSAARRVVVTTAAMRDYVEQQYHVTSDKVRVIPNYVLTDLFSPREEPVAPNQLCFVGRLGEQKNPLALVEACGGLDVELVMIGDGPLRVRIAETAARLCVNLKLMGNLPYAELPNVLNRSAIFVYVSTYEGHPKALIEAMACGLPVIGANSPGIRELIHHGETGWLCGTDPDSIRAAIQELLARPELRAQLGSKARQFVVENFALDRIVEFELAVLREVVKG